MSRKKRRDGRRMLAFALAAVALMGISFGVGWKLGVRSTKFHGSILLVNAANPLPLDYEPEGLVCLYEQPHAFRLAASDIYLTWDAYDAAQRMFKAAENENVNGFIITSGYRTAERQREIYDESEPGLAALPGTSEHQTGLAFDVTAESSSGDFETTDQYRWLCLHAHEYGFIQRYPANKADITGISYEPWHYRYVGAAASTAMFGTGMTLEEFIASNQ